MKKLWRTAPILIAVLMIALVSHDAMPTLAQGRLTVSELCSTEPAQTRSWRISNSYTNQVSYRWHLLNSEQRGSGSLNQGASIVISTATIPGSNTLRVRSAGPDVEVTSSGADCDAAAQPTQLPAMPTSSPGGNQQNGAPAGSAPGNNPAATGGQAGGSVQQGSANPAALAGCGNPDCSEIVVTASCYQGDALFIISNRGAAGAGDMVQWAGWRVTVNDVLMDAGSYQLAGGQSGQVVYAGGGQVTRLEADQQPWQQNGAAVSASISCGAPQAVFLAQGAEKVWVCHSTGSASNPWVAIRVAVSATRNGHVQIGSDGSARAVDGHHADRILPDVPQGLNRRQVEEQYCAAVVIDITPTALPSETATNTPMPSPSETATPSASAEPPTVTASAEPPTVTASAEPPTATASAEPPTATASAEPPTVTASAEPPTVTVTPSATNTPTPSITPTVENCDLLVAAGDVAGLVSAINEANADPALTVICLTDGTYALGGSLLPVLSSQIEMQGAGAELTTSGEQIFRVNAQVSLQEMTLSGGSSTNGGAIYNQGGSLTLENVSISGASAARGGAVYNDNALLIVQNSTFSANTASELGGAIYSFGSSSVTISASTFDGNSAGAAGGAIANYDGSLTVSSSTFRNQNAQNGAAIYNNNLGSFSVQSSVFEGNSATYFGAALSSDGASGALTGSCIVGNSSAVGDVANFGAAAVDATGNWWGAADGPGGSAAGSGSTIYGNVTYLPYSTTPLAICGG